MIAIIKKFKLHYILLTLFTSFLLLIRILLVKSYSIDLNGLEYYFVNILQRLSASKELYPNPLAFPYVNCLYTPIYFYLSMIILKVYKLNPVINIHEILVAGRVLSVLLIFGQFYFIQKIIKKFTSEKFIIFLSFTLYLLLITGHMYAMRPDALKIFFFAAFLYYHIEYHFYSRQNKHLILAVLFAIFAFFTKQDIIIHLTICFAVTLFILRNKKAIVEILLFGISCDIVMLLLYFVYGKYLFTNLFLLNMQSIKQITSTYVIVIIICSLLRTFPFIFLAVKNFKNSKNKPEEKLIKFLTYVSVLLFTASHFSLSRAGGNLNYTFELLVLLVLQLPIYVYYNKEKNITIKQSVTLLIFMFFLYYPNAVTNAYQIDDKKELSLKTKYNNYFLEKAQIDTVIKNDTIFFPNTSYDIFYTDKNVVYGHDMHLSRFIELYSGVEFSSNLTFLSTKYYDENFNNGNIKYIIVEANKKSISHLAKYYPAYVFYKKINQLLIYKYQKTIV